MHTKKIISAVLALVMLLCFSFISAYAGTAYISEITVAAGADSILSLENQGYTVLFQCMNTVFASDSAVFIGYKKGGSAITDIIADTEKADSITVNGVTYTLASSVNLNKGTDGAAIYLYFTKDAKAGNGIVSLETLTIADGEGSLDSLFNDGSAPVLDCDGRLANIEKGIEGKGLYLKKISSGSVKQYIGKASLVSGTSRENALLNAINGGYNCFLDESLTKTGYTYLVYGRTAEKSEALTGLCLTKGDYAEAGLDIAGTAGSMNLLTGKGNGAPLLDINSSRLFGEKFTLGDWAALYFAGIPSGSAKSQMFREAEYKQMLADGAQCSCVASGTAESGINIYGIYCGISGSPEFDEVTDAETMPEETGTEDISVNENVTDSLMDNEKTDGITEEETDARDDTSASSVLGGGNVRAVIILAAALVAAAVCVCVVKKRKEQKPDENN